MSCSDLWARALSHVFQCHRLSECVCLCVCVCATLILASVSQTAKQSDWLELGRVTWDKENIRRVILADQTAALLQRASYELCYTGCHAWEGRSSLTLRFTRGSRCCGMLWKKKKTWEEERVGKAYWKGARHEGSIDNRWLMQDFPPLWEQWGHTSFGGVKTAIGAGEQAECGRFKHVARTRMVTSVPSLLFLPPRHTHSPFLLSSTSGSGFNPFKEGLGRTRESQLHADMHQREGKKERK